MLNQNQTVEEHRLEFFQHDQIVFLATHGPITGDRLPEEVLSDWKAVLQQSLAQREPSWELSEELPPRSYSFPAVPDEISATVPRDYLEEQYPGDFSILAVNVKNEREKRRDLFELIKDLDKGREGLTSAELTIEGVFPNWIASSGKSDSGGTGGPGGDPEPYTDSLHPVPYYFEHLISQLRDKNLYGDGTGVDVVILDTAPSDHDLVLAHKELVKVPQQQGRPFHRLLENLLGPTGRLKPYHATYEEQQRMGNTSLNKRGYKMDDHGLFIAGIIHSIVPNATIHLIEVLNQFGVGDLETIARGLAKAYAILLLNKQPMVVSKSLMLDIPSRYKKHLYRKTDKETISEVEREVEEMVREEVDRELGRLEEKKVKRPEDESHWVLALRVMCERLAKAGRQIVAAAGNDSEKQGGQRNARDARYAAAFTRVIGVGALPKDAGPNPSGRYEASSFSNLADKPPQSGVMALGGESGANNGVLGVYIGEFPPITDEDGSVEEYGWAGSGPKSENGWAWWAGTSFATPILTGAIAAVLSGSESPKTTQQAISALYRECIIENAKTDKEEDVMPASLIQTVNPNDISS